MKIFNIGRLLDLLPCSEQWKKFLGRAASVIAANVFVYLICNDTPRVSIMATIVMSYCNWVFLIRFIYHGWYVCEACGRLKVLKPNQKADTPCVCDMCAIRMAHTNEAIARIAVVAVHERGQSKPRPNPPPVCGPAFGRPKKPAGLNPVP